MSWRISLTDVVVTEEDIAAVMQCFSEGWITMGPRTQEFETAFADRCGLEHAVAVSSGTAALHLALLGAGIGPGDEVLVPAMTFVAAAAVVRYCGGTPVFVDSCSPQDHNIDVDAAAALIGPHTRAILATHWLGYPCDLPALERLCEQHGLLLIEDCAQSITATDAAGRLTGTVGAAGCFSFFSKKQLSVGEGGMVITADADIAAKVRLLRSHAMTSVTWDRHLGYAESYDVVDLGFNFRIDEARAALGLSRLGRLSDDVASRRALVRRYRELVVGIPGIEIPWSDEEVERSSHFGFPIMFETGAERDRVAAALSANQVQTTWYPAITAFSAYHEHPRQPRAEDIAARHLVLPLSASYSTDDIEFVVAELKETVAAGVPRGA